MHKGLFPPSVEQRFPHLTPYAGVDDVGKAAKDWPKINFVIYHSAYRWTGGAGALAKDGYAQFEQTGRVEWTSDLADIPGKYGVSNVYGDLGQIFAQTTVVEPRLCAALMGMLIKGMGADHVVWGTDALWTGAPQWQIEGLRRLEIPEEMRKKYGFAELGPADGPVKQRDLRRQLGEDVPLRRQEGCLARRPLRRDQVGLRAHRPRSLQPALRLRRSFVTRYGIVGFGRIGQRLAARLPGAVAVLSRSPVATAGDVPICRDLRAFLGHRPEVVVECASREASAEIGPKVLAAGCDLVPLSLTALADRDVECRLMAAADTGPGRIEIAPGAIGTLDLLATAREEGMNARRLWPTQVAGHVEAGRGRAPDRLRLDQRAAPYSGAAACARWRRRFHGQPQHLGGRRAGGARPRPRRGRTGRRSGAVRDRARAEIHAAPGNAVMKLGGRDVPPDGDPVDYTTFSLMRVLRRRNARVTI